MSRPSLAELRARCLKPQPERLGNWFARRIVRPLALRITWLILPSGCSPHAVTLAAFAAALLGTALLAQGSAASLALAAIAWHAWYLLDHVDGQVARWRGTATLDGTQLDYLMHHVVHLLLPTGIGWGLFVRAGDPQWLLLSGGWALGLLLLGLHHDTRYKAFVQRLKLLHGELRLVGGGGGRPAPPTPAPRCPLRCMVWLARKACEPPGLLGLLTVAACWSVYWPAASHVLLQGAVALLAPASLLLAAWDIARSIRAGACEREFALWFRPRPGDRLLFEGGYYHVQPQAPLDQRPSRVHATAQMAEHNKPPPPQIHKAA